MSLILKGIDIPSKNAKDYIVISWYETNTHGGLDLKSKFVERADIVQIPKDHGRLIDIEKLKEEFAMKNNICKECDSFKKCDNKTYSKSEVCEKIIWVPTILESEENDENGDMDNSNNRTD